jgi:hypothetical protein
MMAALNKMKKKRAKESRINFKKNLVNEKRGLQIKRKKLTSAIFKILHRGDPPPNPKFKEVQMQLLFFNTIVEL